MGAQGIAELKVGNSYFGGWKTLDVTRSIEQLAGTFELGVTERWPGQAITRPIKPGAPCQLLLDGDPVITGYTDDAEPEFDKDSHEISVKGRDKTGDLVDCSAIYKTGQWHNVKLDTLARNLVKPFGIEVKVETDVGSPFPSYAIGEGETVFECIDRAARMKAVLLTSDTEGNLVITRASKEVVGVKLVEGVNILSGKGVFSWKDRFSSYTVKGQAKATDDIFGEGAAQPQGKSTDETIDRYRPLIVIAEEHGHGATLKQRAEWEKNVRMGRGNRAVITVQGWRRPDNGGLWMPNTLLPVTSPSLWLDAQMLIVGCKWKLDEHGTTTQLSIATREAFELVAGIGRSKLQHKLNDKLQHEKHKKGEDWSQL